MNDEQAPLPAGALEAQSEADIIAAQLKLWEFLGKRVARYTMGESNSVRTELAQELLASICFTIGLDAGNPAAQNDLLRWDLDRRFADGLAELERKMEQFQGLWQAACLSVPKLENRSLHDTLKSLGSFGRRYDHRFFAHMIPCDIDYQLCQPVPETLLGVDYVNEYLRRLLIEHELLRRFDERPCIKLLTAYCRDYRGLLINLYEPVATNAIGLALCGGDVLALHVSAAQRQQIARMLRPQSGDVAVELLQAAASRACDVLSLRRLPARRYLRTLAAQLWPRVEAGSLEGIFLSLR